MPGNEATSDTTTNQNVVVWARSRLGQQVGRGECWDLADQALRQAGAQSSTTTGANDDYVWGDPVELKDATPGDILQFRDHVVKTVTVVTTTFADGSEMEETSEVTQTRPHHTAVVEATPGAGQLQILEQHVKPGGKKVQNHKLATQSTSPTVKKEAKTVKNPTTGKLQTATVVTTVKVTVSGKIRAYHPKAKQ